MVKQVLDFVKHNVMARGSTLLSTSVLVVAEYNFLHELSTEKVRQMFFTALSIHLLRVQDERLGGTPDPVLVEHDCPWMYIIGGYYLQLVVFLVGKLSRCYPGL